MPVKSPGAALPVPCVEVAPMLSDGAAVETGVQLAGAGIDIVDIADIAVIDLLS
jgi:hypothetical protein